ncbi:hypothetical protein NMY22_g12002 [Coprinellus aureogranulatus]|nr:hypothetical protein NMY22_g12002 [Coprinellus aureogranulatus]
MPRRHGQLARTAFPLDDLPPELLATVLSFVDFSKRGPGTITDVARVCKKWRDLVYSQPACWTSLTIPAHRVPKGLRDPDEFQEALLSYMKRMVDRSGSLPLRLDLSVVLSGAPALASRLTQFLTGTSRLEALCIDERHRSFHGHHGTSPWLVSLLQGALAVSKAQGSPCWPILRSLKFRSVTDGLGADTRLPIVEVAPSLESIDFTIYNVGDPFGLWESLIKLKALRHLRLDASIRATNSTKAALILQGIGLVSQLETLSIRNVDEDDGKVQTASVSPLVPALPVSNLSLTHLNLWDNLGTRYSLCNLFLPALSSLRLFRDYPSRPMYNVVSLGEAIRQLVETSSCKLKILRLEAISPCTEDLISTFPALSSLEILELRSACPVGFNISLGSLMFLSELSTVSAPLSLKTSVDDFLPSLKEFVYHDDLLDAKYIPDLMVHFKNFVEHLSRQCSDATTIEAEFPAAGRGNPPIIWRERRDTKHLGDEGESQDASELIKQYCPLEKAVLFAGGHFNPPVYSRFIEPTFDGSPEEAPANAELLNHLKIDQLKALMSECGTKPSCSKPKKQGQIFRLKPRITLAYDSPRPDRCDIDIPQNPYLRASQRNPQRQIDTSPLRSWSPVIPPSPFPQLAHLSESMDALPPEILATVFSFMDFGECSPNFIIRVASVCRRWRDIVYSRREFWTSLTVPAHKTPTDLEDGCTHTTALLGYMQRMFDRSGNLPLNLVLKTFHTGATAPPRLTQFLVEASRLEELSIEALSPPFEYQHRRGLNPWLSALLEEALHLSKIHGGPCWASLRCLKFSSSTHGLSGRAELPLVEVAPSLERIDFALYSIEDPSGVWNSLIKLKALRHLRLDSRIRGSEATKEIFILQIIRSSEQLESLTIRDLHDSQAEVGMLPTPAPTYTFSNVTLSHLDLCDNLGTRHALCKLSLPALVSLRLSRDYHSWDMHHFVSLGEAITQLVENSSCKLKSLRLEAMSMSPFTERVLEIFPAVPMLEILELRCGYPIGPFSSSSSTGSLPFLSELSARSRHPSLENKFRGKNGLLPSLKKFIYQDDLLVANYIPDLVGLFKRFVEDKSRRCTSTTSIQAEFSRPESGRPPIIWRKRQIHSANKLRNVAGWEERNCLLEDAVLFAGGHYDPPVYSLFAEQPFSGPPEDAPASAALLMCLKMDDLKALVAECGGSLDALCTRKKPRKKDLTYAILTSLHTVTCERVEEILDERYAERHQAQEA